MVFVRRTHARAVESGHTAAGEGWEGVRDALRLQSWHLLPPTVEIRPAPAPQLWAAAARRGEDSTAREGKKAVAARHCSPVRG